MKRWLILLAVGAAACGDDKNGNGTPDAAVADTAAAVPDANVGDEDATVPDAAPAMTVEIGTGADMFMSLTDHQLVPFTQGPQGGGACEGYHLWGSVRVTGFSPQNVRVKFQYLRASDRTDVIAMQERIVPLEPNGDGYVAYGFAPRVRNCCDVLATDIIMTVEVESGGKLGTDERTIVTPATCVDQGSGQSVCPRTCP